MRPIRVFAGLVGFVVIASTCSVAGATIIYVDDDASPGGNGLSWPTAFRFLQDALAAAQPSDEIRVAQGTYYPDRDAAHPTGTADRALSFTLKDGVGLYGSYAGLGATDPNARDIAAYVTVLSGDIGAPGDDSDNSYHVVHGGSTSASALLDGFTITDGNANGAAPHDRGGGVRCDDSSSPTLANCTIAGNTASLNGGGVYCGYFSRPTLTNCDIVNNVADHGGGLHFYDSSSPTLADCTIAGNLAADGGGVYCDHSDYHAIPTLTNCTIAQNTAAGSGGGVYGDGYAILVLTACTIIGNTAGGDGAGVHGGWYSSLTLTSCSITDNAAGTDGGGVYCGSYADATLTACTITDNVASERGAGVCCHCFSAKLTSCTLKSNVAGGNGGGVYCDASSLTLVNSTLADNVGGNGGGVYCEANPTARLTNCTFTGNAAASKGGGLYRSAISNPIFTNCILWANTPQAIYPQGGSMVVTYCDVQGGWSGTGNIDADPEFAFPDDPHLLNSSPCIDAGTNSPSGGLPSSDADGLARVLDGDGDGSTVADMGACEFDPATPTLALSATRLTITALTGQTGSRALEIRNSTCGALAWELHCAADWLTADPVAGESAGEVDTVTLTASTTDLTHGTYVTTAWVNAAQALNAPRAVTVVLRVAGTLHVPSEYPTIQAAIDAATFPGDEVVIADGVYAGPGNINLDFRGRAIPLRSVSGDPALCTIDCEGNGCGFYFHSGEGPASNVQGLTIRNASNSGVYCSGSSPRLVNCRITGNTTGDNGGGVYCTDQASPSLVNCTLAGNTSMNDGGALYCGYYSSPTLINCTLASNTAAHRGGGLSCHNYSNPTLTNCILWPNTPEAIYVRSGNPDVTYCNVQGGFVGTGNINASALFVRDPDPGPDGQWGTLDDDYGDLRLTHGSTCIDAGNNLAVPSTIATDLSGNPRFVDVTCRPDSGNGPPPIVDLGAYEAPDDLLIDCNGNGVDDLCETLGGTSTDCNVNGVPDACEIAGGSSPDCNGNAVPDECDLDGGTSLDCNLNGYPDECEPDCNGNGQADECDIFQGASFDCDANGVPDECELHPDCNQNYVPDECDLLSGTSIDANANGIPDECEICAGDLDCSGAVDFVDINAFVLYLSNFPVWQTTYAGCDAANGDLDGNGVYPALADINAFVTLLSTHSLPLACGDR